MWHDLWCGIVGAVSLAVVLYIIGSVGAYLDHRKRAKDRKLPKESVLAITGIIG